jgi:hypothetical protein
MNADCIINWTKVRLMYWLGCRIDMLGLLMGGLIASEVANFLKQDWRQLTRAQGVIEMDFKLFMCRAKVDTEPAMIDCRRYFSEIYSTWQKSTYARKASVA